MQNNAPYRYCLLYLINSLISLISVFSVDAEWIAKDDMYKHLPEDLLNFHILERTVFSQTDSLDELPANIATPRFQNWYSEYVVCLCLTFYCRLNDLVRHISLMFEFHEISHDMGEVSG